MVADLQLGFIGLVMRLAEVGFRGYRRGDDLVTLHAHDLGTLHGHDLGT